MNQAVRSPKPQPSSQGYGSASTPPMICDQGMMPKIITTKVKVTQSSTAMCRPVSGGGTGASVASVSPGRNPTREAAGSAFTLAA